MNATYNDGTGDTLTAEPASIRLLSIDSSRDECGFIIKADATADDLKKLGVIL